MFFCISVFLPPLSLFSLLCSFLCLSLIVVNFLPSLCPIFSVNHSDFLPVFLSICLSVLLLCPSPLPILSVNLSVYLSLCFAFMSLTSSHPFCLSFCLSVYLSIFLLLCPILSHSSLSCIENCREVFYVGCKSKSKISAESDWRIPIAEL